MLRSLLLLGALGVTNVLARPSAAASPEAYVTPGPVLRRQGLTNQNPDHPNESILGNPKDYVQTDLGPNNPVVTYDGSTYHYIEGHTRYTSLVTVTTNNVATTTSTEVKVSATTVATDGPAGKAGDVAIYFTQDVAEALKKFTDTVAQACNLPAKRNLHARQEDPTTCLVRHAIEASGEGGPLSGVAPAEFWTSLPVSKSASVGEIITALGGAVVNSEAGAITLMLIAAGLAAREFKDQIMAAFKVPKGVVGGSSDGTEPLRPVTRICNQQVNKDSPRCTDTACTGVKAKCTTGEHLGCGCVIDGKPHPPQAGDKAWWDEQQKIFDEIDTADLGPSSDPVEAPKATPTCNFGNNWRLKRDMFLEKGKDFCKEKNGKLIRKMPINPYSNAETKYWKDGATDGAQVFMFSYLNQGCDASTHIVQADCEAAVQVIFDRCDGGQDLKGGAASINCQWYNITAVDKCMGDPTAENCNVGQLPGNYGGWPLGDKPRMIWL